MLLSLYMLITMISLKQNMFLTFCSYSVVTEYRIPTSNVISRDKSIVLRYYFSKYLHCA